MVSLKLFAGTDIGLRENNEDNFIVCPDLVKNEWIVPADNQQETYPGARGSLMVVADGMGGQNAGEVASAIAIETVRNMLSSDHIPADISCKPDEIKLFLKSVISKCDTAVKKAAKDNPSTFGMGSTIIIAWLIGHKLYIAWLGDSRAYSFVKDKGIARLSKDHSYVQRLLDSGEITEDEAMSHPDSNVITRSLGDLSQKAKPDVVEYDVDDGEVVMLCTDGLCGVCTDEEIGGIIEDEHGNLQRCKEKLTAAALAAGGSDNITIALMQVHVSGDVAGDTPAENKNSGRYASSFVKIAALCFCLLTVFMFIGWCAFSSKQTIEKVTLSLDKYKLAPGEKTKLHLLREGQRDVTLDYDKNLIDVNLNDSTLTVKKFFFLTDTTIIVKAMWLPDRSLADSVSVSITKSEIEVHKQFDGVMNEISAEHGEALHPGNGSSTQQQVISSGNGEVSPDAHEPKAPSDPDGTEGGITSSKDTKNPDIITKQP